MASTRAAHLDVTSDGNGVRERAIQLGPEGELVGVLASPGRGPTDSVGTAPTVLFLNAGVIHRVGPHRLHVVLARRLAAQGVTSLRLDLSGIGDSRSVPGSLSFRQSAVADVRAAMDRLAADTGASRFVLFGLCSGADNALATGLADERVIGMVLLDPPAYVTTRARARKLARRVRSLGGVREVAAWGAGAIARRVRARLDPDEPSDEEENTGGRETPPVEEYRGWLHTLVGRGVGILAVFTGALGVRYNDPDQLYELFPELRGKVERAYFPDANHTFTELAAQAELVSTVSDWIARRR
jgi:pimeloyl-ACP methyl ester carboxylesterase